MSLRNFLAALLLPACLAGCGFTPIAATPGGGAFGEQDLTLSQLDIGSSDSRFRFHLRQELLRSIVIDPAAAQSLQLSTDIDNEGLAIEQDDEITRLNVIAETTYVLRERPRDPEADPPAPLTGETRAVTAVNTTASQFAAGVSQREAVERLAVETALRIVTLLRVNRPDRDGGQGS